MPAQPPSPDQIRNLIDRAERKKLTPAEAARLREGLGVVTPLRRSHVSNRWSNRVRRLRTLIYEAHTQIPYDGGTICSECSSFNGIRPLGFTVEWPCPTIYAIDDVFPPREKEAA
jgi:hypothetical protein